MLEIQKRHTQKSTLRKPTKTLTTLEDDCQSQPLHIAFDALQMCQHNYLWAWQLLRTATSLLIGPRYPTLFFKQAGNEQQPT